MTHKIKEMSRIIIQNSTSSVSDADCLTYVQKVIQEGRISDNGKQYCYVTRFTNDVMVATQLNKKSDKFIVYDDNREEIL